MSLKLTNKDVLIHLDDFEPTMENIFIAKPVEKKKGAITYYKPNIYIRYPVMNEEGRAVRVNGKIKYTDNMGRFYCQFPERFSFGVQEIIDMTSKAPTGNYSLSVSLFPREDVTDYDRSLQTKLEEFINVCKDKLVEHKDAMGFNKMNVHTIDDSMSKLLYYSKDKVSKLPLPEKGATMSPKLIKVKETFESTFYIKDRYDSKGNAIVTDPMDYLSDSATKKYCLCNIQPVILFDTIYVAGVSKAHFQTKVAECIIEKVQQKTTKFLGNKKGKPSIVDDEEVGEVEDQIDENDQEIDEKDERESDIDEQKDNNEKDEVEEVNNSIEKVIISITDDEKEVEEKTPLKTKTKTKKKIVKL